MKKVLTLICLAFAFISNAQWSGTPNIYYNGGNVGIGTTTPATKLQVVGGHISTATDAGLSGFVQLWNDNAIIWRAGNANAGLRFGSAADLSAGSWSEKMRLTDQGRLGIGTAGPNARLTVVAGGQSDGIWLAGTGTTNVALLNNITSGAYNSLSQNGDNLLLWRGSGVDAADAGGLVIGSWSNSAAGLRITSAGSVGIGTPTPGPYKLAVEGMLGARKIKVTQALPWADYVFYDDYRLPTLHEVEKFIKEHKHLPEIPSAAEIQKDGVDLGDNQTLLLKKIEELTLYLIEQNKKAEKQEEKIDEQDRQIAEQNKIIAQLIIEVKELKSAFNK